MAQKQKHGAPSASPTPESRSDPPPGESLADVLSHFSRFAWDALGVSLLSLSLMTMVGLLAPELSSGLLAGWTGMLKVWLGWGALWIAALLGLLGIWLFRRRLIPGRPSTGFWLRFTALELAGFAAMGLFSVLAGVDPVGADRGEAGGRIGWALAEMLRRLLQPFRLDFLPLIGMIFALAAALFLYIGLRGRLLLHVSISRPAVEPLGTEFAPEGVIESPLRPEDTSSPVVRRRPAPLPPQFRKNFRIEPDEPAPVPVGPRSELLPPLDLLVYEQFSRPDERTINQTAGLIEKTLADFGIPARVIDFRVGPTVTQFAVEPGYVEKDKTPLENGEAAARQKVRVAQISALSRDLALTLSAERLRIEAPVPGRPYVGIEVPNPRASVVRIRPLIESEAFRKLNAPLTLALGRDVSGQPAVADLARMPHLLIAGTTGSGKSVCIAAITTCLVMNNTPEQLRLVMIDPKMVELVRFNGLPHLFGKVETDVERIGGVMRWVVAEMDRRYKVLEASHSRNMESHNRKAARRKGMELMPYIVVLIDELADLMMAAPEQTEHNLVRLAQMARAVGIHLVVATQRPGVEVVTGLIKANFPARMSFAVASSIDSRVILDTVGAENLLGRGDMLFLPPDASGPKRLQGVMVSDTEVEKVINYWQRAVSVPGDGVSPPPWEEMLARQEILADRDGLIEQAIEVARKEGRVNVSMLQRRLRIGYPRAARLIDELEDMGVIAPAGGPTRDREVLIDREDDEH